MGKASSNKKVARAAGAGGGRAYRGRRPWTYYSVLAVIVALGVLLTWTSRTHRLDQINQAGTQTPPTVGTVSNEGYAVYVCGKWIAPFTKVNNGQNFSTSSGPNAGIINIHPQVKSAAGKNATLGRFASAVGMTLNSTELALPGGKQYVDGDSCEGHAGGVYIKQFHDTGDTVGQVYNGAKGQLPRTPPNEVHLQDQALLTIAFVPPSQVNDIPAPPAYVYANLKKFQPAGSTTTTTLPTVTIPNGTSTTVKK